MSKTCEGLPAMFEGRAAAEVLAAGAAEWTSKPLVSVIIPTRNRADCLPRALDSAYEQEGRAELFDLEVIVVDDASSDETSSVIERYPDVRYIRLPEQCGVSAARNVALRASQGRYIAFLDDDDMWLSSKLRIQVPILTAHSDVGVLYSQSVVRSDGTEALYPDARTAPSGRVFMDMLMDNFAGHHASQLIRRTAFEKAGYFDETLRSHVDYDVSLRLAFHVPFLFVPGAVDIYNLSPRALWLTRAASGMGQADAVRVVEKALRLLPDAPQYDEVKRVARARVTLHAAHPLVLAGELPQARATVLNTLRAYPWILRHDWARYTLAYVAGKLALPTSSPIATAREFCADVRSAALNRTVGDRWDLRRTIGMMWAGTAYALASSEPARDRDSAYAATVAMLTMPSLPRRPALVRLIVRGVAGRRAEAFCAGWYIRMRSMLGAADRDPPEVAGVERHGRQADLATPSPSLGAHSRPSHQRLQQRRAP